jgi:hypothetical protein
VVTNLTLLGRPAIGRGARAAHQHRSIAQAVSVEEGLDGLLVVDDCVGASPVRAPQAALEPPGIEYLGERRNRGGPPSTHFKPGNPGGPGRPRGIPNRIKADLAQLILDAAGEAGYLKKNKRGNFVPTGDKGCKGYLLWLAVHEPRTYASLMGRVLPYYVSTDLPEPILSRDETLAQLKERGLPIELLQHLQRATAPLDDDEDTDPYRSPDDAIDVTPNDAGKK